MDSSKKNIDSPKSSGGMLDISDKVLHPEENAFQSVAKRKFRASVFDGFVEKAAEAEKKVRHGVVDGVGKATEATMKVGNVVIGNSAPTQTQVIMEQATDSYNEVANEDKRKSVGWKKVATFVTAEAGMGGLKAKMLSSMKDPEEREAVIRQIGTKLRGSFLFISLDCKEIFDLTMQFEIATYNVGEVIIEQGVVDDGGYYYMLTEGECAVFKNGKILPGKFGTMPEGSSFGEQAVLFESSVRGASVVASKGSEKEENKDRVVVYRLSGKEFRSRLGKEELTALQDKVTSVMKVFDQLGGVETKIAAKGTIIRQYKPDSLSLLRHYRGTVVQYVWPEVLFMMVITAAFGVLVDYFDGGIGGGLDDDPEPNTLLWHLNYLTGVLARLMPLTTFTATFFLNQAFSSWKRFYWTTRGMQGRFNDLSLILASHAAVDEEGEITPEAKKALDDIARIQRVLHQLYWSTVVKRFNSLHSPEGLSYLLSFGLIREDEYDSLITASANKLGVHHASMLFMTRRIVLAKKSGEIELDTASAQMVFDKITNLRMLMARIPDMYDGRMPLQYVHFLNMLVTTLVFLSPFALFPVLYYWSVLAVGLLTLFYKGILTLSLMFLDPVDNDEYHSKFVESAGFDIGVLIREANAGSVRFAACADCLPKGYLASLKAIKK